MANDDRQYHWQWQQDRITKMKTAIRNDPLQLRVFTNHSSKLQD